MLGVDDPNNGVRRYTPCADAAQNELEMYNAAESVAMANRTHYYRTHKYNQFYTLWYAVLWFDFVFYLVRLKIEF
jgi:hypothetical protein